jgi:hypothetical protein
VVASSIYRNHTNIPSINPPEEMPNCRVNNADARHIIQHISNTGLLISMTSCHMASSIDVAVRVGRAGNGQNAAGACGGGRGLHSSTSLLNMSRS